eukprot:COSAG06_NODE_980_length_11224_cov_324.998382_1_plen_98_part_10
MWEQAGGLDLSGDVTWDAASLTATVELGVVVASQGASLQLSWAESPRSELLCRSGANHITSASNFTFHVCPVPVLACHRFHETKNGCQKRRGCKQTIT